MNEAQSAWLFKNILHGYDEEKSIMFWTACKERQEGNAGIPHERQNRRMLLYCAWKSEAIQALRFAQGHSWPLFSRTFHAFDLFCLLCLCWIPVLTKKKCVFLNFYIRKAFKNTHGHYEQASCFAVIVQDSFFMLKPCSGKSIFAGVTYLVTLFQNFLHKTRQLSKVQYITFL